MTDTSHRDAAWWRRFAIGVGLMFFANLAPLLRCWAVAPAGFVQLGFPFFFYQSSACIVGLTPVSEVRLELFLLDLVILFVVANLCADHCHGGVATTFCRLRTWGHPKD